MDFTGKRVLITGGGRGIGRASAQQFAQAGARVAINYRRDRAAALSTLESLNGSGHCVLQADISDPDEVKRLVAEFEAALGRPDILVNNAGIHIDHPIDQGDYHSWQQAWQDTLALNLLAVANLCYAVIPSMLAEGGGRIVNVSSRGAFRGEPIAPAYGASKAALNSLSQSLAVYLAPKNIFVGVVAPGWVETDMAAAVLNGPGSEALIAQYPMGRVARPEEVAHAIAYMAAPGSAFSTGAILDVNGASYLRS